MFTNLTHLMQTKEKKIPKKESVTVGHGGVNVTVWVFFFAVEIARICRLIQTSFITSKAAGKSEVEEEANLSAG